MVLGLAVGENRAVLELGAEPGHRLREIARCHHERTPGDLFRLGRVDGDDTSARHRQGDQLHMEDVVQLDVRHVFLVSRNAAIAAATAR